MDKVLVQLDPCFFEPLHAACVLPYQLYGLLSCMHRFHTLILFYCAHRAKRKLSNYVSNWNYDETRSSD
jgi:hypothetical protein